MKNCLFCGQQLKPVLSFSFIFSFQSFAEPLICASCFEQFHRIDWEQACPGCSREQADTHLCSDCRTWQKKYPELTLKHHALFTYNERAQEYLKAYKIQGDLLLAQLFKKELQEVLRPYQRNYQLLVLPISEKSFASRGFNQVSVLLDAAGISYQDLLIHNGQGVKQSAKNRQERLMSPQFFDWKAGQELNQKKDKILLIDDIYTTGRTLMHAKNLLGEKNCGREGKPLTIESFTLFR